MATPGAWSVTADDVKAATSRANFSMGDFGEPSRTPLTDTVYALNLANKAATGYTQFEAMRQHAQGLEVLLAEAGIRISDGNAELAALKARIAERNKADPVWRLHNLCDAMDEDAKDSPYSEEAWKLQEDAYRQKCEELKAAGVYAMELRALLKEAYTHVEYDEGGRLGNRIDAALAKNPASYPDPAHEYMAENVAADTELTVARCPHCHERVESIGNPCPRHQNSSLPVQEKP